MQDLDPDHPRSPRYVQTQSSLYHGQGYLGKAPDLDVGERVNQGLDASPWEMVSSAVSEKRDESWLPYRLRGEATFGSG